MRWVAIWMVGALSVGCVSQPRFAGPLPVRNQHPAQLTVMHMAPASAVVLPKGTVQARADAAYSSLFLNGIDLGRSYFMDGEYLRFGTSLRAGLGRNLEFGIELPFAHTSGGFLDGFLLDYHKAFGLPDQDRGVVANDDFRIEAVQNGQVVWQVEKGGVELLDVPLSLTWQLTPVESGLGVALRGGFELPTGDGDRGYGNGEVDYSAGVVLECHGGGIAATGYAQYTFAGTPDIARRGGLTFGDVVSVGFATEMPVADSLHVFSQFAFETSTLRDLGLRATGREQLMLWVGGRFHLSDGCGLEIAFGEDLRGFVSPDFTAWIGFTTLAF